MKISHPLESVFNMAADDNEFEKDYEMIEQPANAVAELTEAPKDLKDEDDVLIEERLDEIYEMAVKTFQDQSAYTEIIEPRYAARNAEVAANYLNIALTAVNSRAKAKTDRKRANQTFVPFNNTGKTTNNIVIADRNQILKMIDIDGDMKELK